MMITTLKKRLSFSKDNLANSSENVNDTTGGGGGSGSGNMSSSSRLSGSGGWSSGWTNWTSWPSFRVRNRDFFGLPPLWHFHRILAGRGNNDTYNCK